MAARNRKGLSEATRSRIQTTMIVKRLEKHIFAKQEIEDGVVITKELMTQSQVTAALGLIKKTLPDLSAVEHSGEVEHTNARTITDDVLANIATGGSSGTTKQTDSTKKIH